MGQVLASSNAAVCSLCRQIPRCLLDTADKVTESDRKELAHLVLSSSAALLALAPCKEQSCLGVGRTKTEGLWLSFHNV